MWLTILVGIEDVVVGVSEGKVVGNRRRLTPIQVAFRLWTV